MGPSGHVKGWPDHYIRLILWVQESVDALVMMVG
jgi:hypothetical protein